jgi:16S rRNA processing protein RimM
VKNTNAKYVVVGKIGTTYGVFGWLKIRTYLEQSRDILKYDTWYLGHENNNDWQPIKVEHSKIHSHTIIAKLAGVNNPEEARSFTGKEIAILRRDLPALKQNEYYWSDLIGLTVVHKDGRTLGKVIYLMSTGSNDVLVIKNGKEHAIPCLFGDVILSVDLDKQQILVDWELI